MSIRSEWFDADYTGVDVAARGYLPPGADEPVTGEVAVIFGADSLAVLEGDRERIRYLLRVALESLDDDAVHLTGEDAEERDAAEGVAR